MQKQIKTIKGIFGQLIHYTNGIKIGESWPGIFNGSYNHYDAKGSYSGYSDPGLFGSQVHHNEFGTRTGETWTDDFGISRHYSEDRSYVGSSYDSFIIRTPHIDDVFDDSDADDSFYRDD